MKGNKIANGKTADQITVAITSQNEDVKSFTKNKIQEKLNSLEMEVLKKVTGNRKELISHRFDIMDEKMKGNAACGKVENSIKSIDVIREHSKQNNAYIGVCLLCSI